MHQQLMTFRAYAASRDLNVSTVSRQVAAGKLPIVVQPSGERLIDVAAADKARASNINIRLGHGGKRDRATRAPLQFAARRDGFEPGQHALLSVLIEDAPELVQRAMLSLGADETNAARAVFAVDQVVQYMAAALFDERARGDYRDKLPDNPDLDWSPDVAAMLETLRTSEPAWVDTIDDAALTFDMLEAGERAKP